VSDPVILRIDRRADPASLEEEIAELVPGRDSVVLRLPLPEDIVASAAAGFERQPDLLLNVEGRAPGRPALTLECLEQFPHVRNLRVKVLDALDLSPIGHLHDLRELRLGATKRRSVSLAFLRETPLIEELSIDSTGGTDFDAVASLQELRRLKLRAARIKTLDGLRDHPTLEVVSVTLGGIRDLRPLATIPNLRALDLWGIRLLDSDDFAAIGDCQALGGLSLAALHHIRDLSALARGPAETLRFLGLSNMKGMETLRHLADCKQLEDVSLGEARPADRRLDALTRAPRLNKLLVGDSYTTSEIETALENFHGQFFYCSGKFYVGDWSTGLPDILDFSRMPNAYLELLNTPPPPA